MNADPNNSKLASVAYTINFNDEDKTNRNNKINLLIERHLGKCFAAVKCGIIMGWGT